ncbi:MAG: PIN domain-containing protein [Deinococcota bacterium]|jgi:predicted nucleic acid-binding protein|nr:PIN domain-containing protein [Deinococcota bacterium]
MSGRAFVDSNVLVYAHDLSAGEKRARAAALLHDLWVTRQGCLSVQVLQEFYNVTTRKQLLTLPLAGASVRWYAQWTIHEPSARDVISAIGLHQEILASFWDAMILTSAARLGCELLWSEDLNPEQHYGGVQVRNPFEAW